MRVIPTLVVFLLVMLTGSSAFADPVSGTILSNVGVPVSGAEIEVQGAGVSVMSNVDGTFSFNVPAGTYNLHVIPPAALDVAPLIVTGLVVNGTTSTGVLNFSLGVVLTGTVTDSGGVPIQNGDLDVFDQNTGIKVYTANDNTTTTGTFSIRVPSGMMRVRAEPAAGQILVAQSQLVNAIANQSIGTITLAAGLQLTGTVVDSSNGTPIAGVDLDVDNPFTGVRIDTPGDNTDALGNFSVIVPFGLYFVSFEAPAGGTPYVARLIEVPVGAAVTNIGSVALNVGVEVTGKVVDNTGFPVANADLDVRMLGGDDKIFVPGDETGPDGTYRLVFPNGLHRIITHPDKSTLLQSQSTGFINFTTSTNLGTTVVQPGVLLSGNVTGFNGSPEAECRIIVRDTATSNLIETVDNLTDAAGNYSVVVPTGTFDVEFQTPKASLSRDTESTGVAVSGPTTLNTSLTLLPMLAYADDLAFPGPKYVNALSPQFFATVGFYNPTGITTGVFLDVEIEEPFGTIIPLLTASPLILGSQQYILASPTPIPLPQVSPGNVGLPHTFRIMLRDPFDNSLIDMDEFTYIPLL